MGTYPWFPLFVDLSEKRVLVVGAGMIATRRAMTLLSFCRRVAVVAPAASRDIAFEAASGRLRLDVRPFEPADLDGADLVVAATDDPTLNADIAALCRARAIPVNVASDHTLCDFYFPGIAMSDDLVVGVTASGKDHRRVRQAAEKLREALEREIP